MSWNKSWKAVFSLTFVAGLAACGQPVPSDSSSLDVTNGIRVKDDLFPSVIALEFNGSICTGTFINDSQVVTAAHCVHDIITARQKPSRMTFTNAAGQTIAATKLVMHPQYVHNTKVLSPHDLAIVNFPAESSRSSSDFYKTEPQKKMVFTIVGFGNNDYTLNASTGVQSATGAGVKRYGQNEILNIADNSMIQFYGSPHSVDEKEEQGTFSASGSGDSGGPLLIEKQLAGVTSGGGLGKFLDSNGVEQVYKVSNYVNLNEQDNKSFLLQHVKSVSSW